MSPDNGVTITGIGLVTPVGRGVAEVFDAFCTGGPASSCHRPSTRRTPSRSPASCRRSTRGTIVSGPDGKVMDRTVVLALLAAEDALADAGLMVGDNVDPDRVGVIVGGVGWPGDAGAAGARPGRTGALRSARTC